MTRSRLEVPWTGGDRNRASVIADLLFAPQEWKHRRVDSLRLNTGDRGRRRTSIDCTLPADGRLTWPTSGTGDQIVVPLGVLTKGPLRDFDIVDSDGRPLSVLGLADSATLSVQVLYYLLEEIDGIALSEGLKKALNEVVLHDPQSSTVPNLDELLYDGRHHGAQVIPPQQEVSTSTASLIRDLLHGYVLFAITPRPTADRRTVVKFSSYWTTTLRPDDPTVPGLGGEALWRVVIRLDDSLARIGIRPAQRPGDEFPTGPVGRMLEYASWRVNIILASLGIRPAPLELPVLGAGDARSFHLELHVPAEIECDALVLPFPRPPRLITGVLDESLEPVAHVHGSYDFPWDDEEAEQAGFAYLTTTPRGTTGVATLTSVATFLFFLLAATLPGAMKTLEHASDPSAVLLTLPAVALTVFLGVREHELASVLLGPVRFIIGMCAALLALAATSLAWDLREPWLHLFWWAALVTSGASVLGLLVGAVQRRRRARDVVRRQV
ncbi:hypothetical protein [Isoptericola sp. NPDC055881]